jgi:hypothetical protein
MRKSSWTTRVEMHYAKPRNDRRSSERKAKRCRPSQEKPGSSQNSESAFIVLCSLILQNAFLCRFFAILGKQLTGLDKVAYYIQMKSANHVSGI